MARRYNRDSRGRFASGGGGGSRRPAARGISRGTNRLTRDNSGRITSVGGDGATARGGRLRTASGKQRATQTARISGGRAAGTVTRSGARRAAAAAAAVKPVEARSGRVRVRGNFRPQNLYTGTDRKAGKGYGTDAKANVAEARRRIEASGAQSALKSNKRSSTVASVNERTPNRVDVNASHTAWRNPRADMIKSRRKNEFSTSSPNHYVAHELGHVRNPSGRMANSWTVQLRKKGEMLADVDTVLNAQRTARRVSRYAMTKPAEFAAETAAGRSLGKKYDNRVMRQFGQVTGRKPPSLRSQLNNQRTTPTKPTTRAAAAAVKPAPKVDTSLKGVAARRARAQAPRTSTYLSQKLNTRSAITRSAANAIYNRQRAVGKQSGLDASVVRNPIGIMPKSSGSIRNRAEQLREAARKRVVGGRRR